VLFLLGSGRVLQSPQQETEISLGLRHHLIPRVVGRMLIPFILLFGLYVQFHGEYGPGGGFQAGAIIAASIILYALIEGERHALEVLPQNLLLGMMAGGAVLYTSHLLDVVERVCDRMAILADGKLVALGTLDELREEAGRDGTLEEVFGTVTHSEDPREAARRILGASP